MEGYGIPLGRVLAPANRHDSPLLAPTLDKLGEIGPLPDDITVHLDAGYDSQKTRDELGERNMTGEIAHKGDKAPIQAGQRWQVERTNSWHNGFNRLQRCYERKEDVIDAFFDLADTIITVRSMIRQSWTLYRWHGRRRNDPDRLPIRATSYKNFAANFARGLAADPAVAALSMRRARSTFICGHLAAGTPVGVLLAVTGIAEAGSLARYARHVAGISSSKGVLRARCRAERTP